MASTSSILMAIYLLFSFCSFSYGQTMTDIYQLHTDVFNNYNKEVIPSVQSLQIELRFFLTNIIEFDEIHGTITLTAAIQMKWTDQVISWTPGSYGNKEYIPLSQSNIWTPPLVLLNSVHDLESVEGDDEFIAIIYHNGTIYWTPGGIMKAKCAIDISKFPFDSQTCTLWFGSFGLSILDVNYTVSSDPNFDTSFFSVNSDWSLESYRAYVSVNQGYSAYYVELTAKRESLYFSVMVICPTILFCLLNPLVFLLPVESGDRIGLSMTIMLSYAIFLTLVSASVPSSSNPMCILLGVMIGIISISGLIVVWVICILMLYYRDESKEMNKLWKFIGSRLTYKKKNTIQPLSDEKEMEINIISWKDVADGFDNLCFIVSYVLIFILLLSFFITVRM